ncbi:MAG: Conserved zinc-finger domain-containing protein [Candidatus Tokpelaia sp. JSC189]|nr:MAG: Conserved zinc-finger domain-containing protein [Candidatus Tokpelaia sp. JSC189]
MANRAIPYFQNDKGYKRIEISVKKFVCIGANPPFDHPHISLEMGTKKEIVCPYCSTLYVFNSKLDETKSNPSDCHYVF